MFVPHAPEASLRPNELHIDISIRHPLVIDHDVAHRTQALHYTVLNVLEQFVGRLHAVGCLR